MVKRALFTLYFSCQHEKANRYSMNNSANTELEQVVHTNRVRVADRENLVN